MTIPDGFPGQRMLVLPAPRVEVALRSPGTAHLTVTDCGYFPNAGAHGRRRVEPITQAVIIICAKGSGWCETEAGRFPIESGQVVILPPGRGHAYGSDPHDPWTLWWLHVGGNDLAEFLSSAGMTTASPVRNLSDPYRAIDLVAEVLRWMERDETTASLLAAAGTAWHLMALLASDRAVGTERHDVIDEAADYLRTQFAERVTVADLARTARLSTSHFATLFARRTGIPVLRFQTQLRMARARELLDTTELPIATVASQVGYPDSFYFSRQFRRAHGLTPNRYRQHRKG